MKIDNGKIIQAAKDELYSYWLSGGWDDVYSFHEYMQRMKDAGVKIEKKKKKKKRTNGDRIRQMDTSGLIDVIVCPYPDMVCIHRCMHGYACKCCKRDWLNAPAKEVDDDTGR